MKIIKRVLLYSILIFGFFIGFFCFAQSDNFNVVESVNGAVVTLDDNVVATKIGQPMFHWYNQLLNLGIVFYPIILVVSGFWFAYGVVKAIINKNDLNSKKSLDNR